MVLPKGYKHSEETKRKISLILKGRVVWNKNIPCSEETKIKISLSKKGQVPWNKGKPHSEKTKKKISEYLKGRISPNKGKKFSEEHKINLSLSHKGKVSGMKGKYHTEETRRKMSLAKKDFVPWSKGLKGKEFFSHFKKGQVWNKGKKLSTEHKKKMVETRMKNNSYKRTEEFKKYQSARLQNIKLEDWKGFSREPYDQRWNNIFRRRIRKRDNYICMLCNIHQEKLNRTLSVHHINYNKKLTIPENCINLCLSCHMKTQINRKHWINFFQSLMNEKYNYQYDENENIILKEVNL